MVLGMELEPGNKEPWKQSLRLKCDVGWAGEILVSMMSPSSAVAHLHSWSVFIEKALAT